MHAAAPGPARLSPSIAPLIALLAVACAAASLALGAADIDLSGVFSPDSLARTIVLELRLPRAILALAVGGMLGLAGAALQAVLRNPLADPSVLGVSNGAALGGVVALYFGFMKVSPVLLPVLAIAGGLIALALLFVLARRMQGPIGLILAGIAIGTLAGAAIALALNRAANPFAMMEITFWLMGSLEDRSFQHVWIALPAIAAGATLVAMNARALDAMVLGDTGARSLGIDLDAVRLRLVLGIAIGIGGAVAVSGAVGFVGLIAPHLVRPLTGNSPSKVLWPSAFAGAALVSAADILVRLVPGQTELRLGVVTAFLGVPVFVFYLVRGRASW